MKCYLCAMDAEEVSSAGEGQQVSCPDCGEYIISQIVRRQLQHRSLDFPTMRDDLHRQRQYNATAIAEINSETVKWA